MYSAMLHRHLEKRRHVAELLALGTDDEYRTDNIHTAHAAVVRQAEDTAIFVTDQHRAVR